MKQTWLNPDIEYLFNNEIYEMDIKRAGLSLIKEYHLLSPEKIDKLSKMDKLGSDIAIGKLQRDSKEFSAVFQQKFVDARALFINANGLSDNRIISVKKDAFFIIGKCAHTKFNQIEFVEKNCYSSYIRFVDNSNIELYYRGDGFDVKGIGEFGLNIHRVFMLQMLQEVVKRLESKSKNVKRYIMDFVYKYRSGTLDEEYYIEFNNKSEAINPIYNYQKILIPIIEIILEEIND